MRVLEPRGEADLAQEPVGADAGGQLGPEHLDGDRPVVAEILGAIDHRHAAPAELTVEAVAVGEVRPRGGPSDRSARRPVGHAYDSAGR